MENGIWNEIYRPKKLEDVINLPKQIPELVNDNLPHLLFVGTAGTGKTTTARIIIKQLGAESLELNASDERGIAVIRDKVKSFAGTMSFNNKFKLVFLDEIDGLTPDAQQSLRNIIEKYNKHCRFIGSANFINKLIEPIRSRFCIVEFGDADKDQIHKRCTHILEDRKVLYQPLALATVVSKCYPDIRKTINTMQLSVVNGKLSKENLKISSDNSRRIYNLIKENNFGEIRNLLVKGNLDVDFLIQDIEEFIYIDEAFDWEKKRKALLLICESNRAMYNVVIKRIEFEFLALNLIGVLK